MGFIASISFAGPMAAETKIVTKPVPTKSINHGMKPAPGPALTSGECKALGGTVSTALACDAGNGCFAADSNGVVHVNCIDEVKH